MSDDLEELLAELRKTIAGNKRFLDKLADESVDVDLEDEPVTVAFEEDFEEL